MHHHCADGCPAEHGDRRDAGLNDKGDLLEGRCGPSDSMTASVASTVMLTWFPAVLAPTLAVLLGGPAFPGFGTLPDRRGPRRGAGGGRGRRHRPETGGTVRFNDPTGSRGKQFALVRRLNGAIDDARAGGTVGWPPTRSPCRAPPGAGPGAPARRRRAGRGGRPLPALGVQRTLRAELRHQHRQGQAS